MVWKCILICNRSSDCLSSLTREASLHAAPCNECYFNALCAYRFFLKKLEINLLSFSKNNLGWEESEGMCYHKSLIRGIIMECTWGRKEFAEQLTKLQTLIEQETDIKRRLYLE